MIDKPKDASKDVLSAARLWSLASEIGFKIAIPLIIFLIAGIKMDQWLGTKPVFMLAGIGLALASSVLLIGQIVKRANEGQV